MLKAEYEAVANHRRLRGIIMGRFHTKYALIFLLLALAGLIFLLRNILTLEVSVASVIFVCDKVTFCLIQHRKNSLVTQWA